MATSDSFIRELLQANKDVSKCPSPDRVVRFFKEILGLLFPEFSSTRYTSAELLKQRIKSSKQHLRTILDANKYCIESGKSGLEEDYFDAIPEIRAKLLLDLEAMYLGDPAAKSRAEVIRTYPGFYAVAAYRIAHQLLKLGITLVPRIISEHAHRETGIDIHPGATIGDHFCIDHGTGIVIGETTDIGSHVKIYQGVTLGGISVRKEDASKKRHPTIKDNVVIYSGATILGGDTVIGEGSVIGGNVWLTHSVPPNSKVYYQAKMSHSEGEPDIITFK